MTFVARDASLVVKLTLKSRCVRPTAVNSMAKAERDDALNTLVRTALLLCRIGQYLNVTRRRDYSPRC
jgi:hypothetical protein